jgi:hypothetical protein
MVSNMICARLDGELQALAKKHRCIYTRYADDITFSTYRPIMPRAIAMSDSGSKVTVGADLDRVIVSNGFNVNAKKVRLQSRGQRQEVTGITVNEFPNVQRNLLRQIRAMLHAWDIYGYEAAQSEFLNKYDRKRREPRENSPLFKRVLKGKIEFVRSVRGSENAYYKQFSMHLRTLAPELYEIAPPTQPQSQEPFRPKSEIQVLTSEIIGPQAMQSPSSTLHVEQSELSTTADSIMGPRVSKGADFDHKLASVLGKSVNDASINPVSLDSAKEGIKSKSRDAFSGYELGLKRLLERIKQDLGDKDQAYYDVLLDQMRLSENIDACRRYNDTDSSREQRYRIIDHLNHLALDALGQSFNEFCDIGQSHFE